MLQTVNMPTSATHPHVPQTRPSGNQKGAPNADARTAAYAGLAAVITRLGRLRIVDDLIW